MNQITQNALHVIHNALHVLCHCTESMLITVLEKILLYPWITILLVTVINNFNRSYNRIQKKVLDQIGQNDSDSSILYFSKYCVSHI